jgi:hypothetical protein
LVVLKKDFVVEIHANRYLSNADGSQRPSRYEDAVETIIRTLAMAK